MQTPDFNYRTLIRAAMTHARRGFLILTVAVLNLLAAVATSTGGPVETNLQKRAFSDANWISMGGFPGANGDVNAAVTDPSGNLYIGGRFTMVGDGLANNVAKWDGVSWTALGGEISGTVHALAVSGSDLYVGGEFTLAGGIAATNIAKWDGSSWSALGSVTGGWPWGGPIVSALAVSGTNLYAGGCFATAGGVPTTNIAKWNGDSWSAVGSGLGDGSSWVSALAVSGSDLYAGGLFYRAGDVVVSCIAKWNGSSWSALGSGMHGPNLPQVSALAMAGSDLYAGGWFTNAGGSPARCIAKWDGSSWSALGSGIDGVVDYDTSLHSWQPFVYALAVAGSDLYVGGNFAKAGGVSATTIAKWNGSSWSALGSGINADRNVSLAPAVNALVVSGNELYAGGDFTIAGGKVSAYLAKAIINPPVLTLEHRASGTNFIRFSGVPGTAYHLQRASDLAGPWPNIATNTAPANGRIAIGDASPSVGQGYYRVVEP